LNGWLRLWIVFAAASLICAVGWGVIEGAKQYRVEHKVIAGFKNPRCLPVIQMPERSKLKPEPGYDDPCLDLYLYRSIYEGAAQTEDAYIRHMNSKQNEVMLQLAGIALIAWLIGISAMYGGGAVVAWVIRGFRSHA
jgi:hypothetical protein